MFISSSAPSSRALTSWLWKQRVKSLSRVWLFATPWTVARKAPPSMGFSRPERWSGVPFPPPGDLPHPGIKPRSPALQADSGPFEPPGKPKYLMGTEFQFWKTKRILEMDGGDGCTRIWLYRISVNCILKVVTMVHFICVYHNKKE